MNSCNITQGLRAWDLTCAEHSSLAAVKKRCTYLHMLDPSERCNFTVHSQCDSEAHLFMYHNFMFCNISYPAFDNPIFILAIFAMTVWLFTIFVCLGTTADEFFCPALGIISKILRLSENLAGVTLLAFGNGAADIFSSITDPFGETILMYNELLGSAMFITTVVAGYIAFIRPFKMQAYPFLRDLLFMLGSTIWVIHTIQDEVIHLYEAISYLVIYVLYIFVVVGGFLIQNKVKKYIQIDEEKPVDWEGLRAKSRISMSRIDLVVSRSRISFEESDSSESSSDADEEHMKIKHGKVTMREMCAEMWERLKPINDENWKEMNRFEKCMEVIKSPVLLILRFFIPAVLVGEDKNGWCKLLNSVQCIFFPAYVITAADYYNTEIYGITIYVPAAALGILVALFVFFTSDFHKQPKYHNVFAFMSLIGSMATIYFFVLEVVAVLSLFGTLGKIKVSTLGLTVLAWGNSIGDAIANFSIAKQGFQRMAFAGCFGGPIANTLLSLGITFLIRDVGSPEHASQVRTGVMGPVCSTFLLINLSYSIFYILLTNFKARKSYGAFLLLLYCEFLIFCLMCELQYVHPLGTDHEFDTDLYETYSGKAW